MEKYESVPKRLEEDYHTIKDDTPLVNVYTTGEVTPKPVESTQGMHKTPRATRTRNPANVQPRKRRGKQTAGESSLPRPSLKIRFKQQNPTSTTPLPPSDDQERDDIHEETQVNLALDKTAKAYKEQHKVAEVEDKILEDDVDKFVEGEEDDDGTEFADTVLLIDVDFSDKLDPRSHKDKLEEINDDDDDNQKDGKKDDDDDNDDNDHDDHALIRTRVTGSSEIRTKKMQIPIPSPPRSLRTDLSSDKAINQELTNSVTPTPATLSQDQSKPTSSRRTNLLGIPKLTVSTTNDHIKESLPKMVTDAVNQERESLQGVVPALISQEFDAHAPQIIEELFRIHM
ncbi:hypothetical protein Tco_0912809 [Tanacetum coccineum]